MGRREASAICGIIPGHNLALQRTLGAMIHSESLWQGVGVGVGTVANFPGLRRIALLDGFDMSVVEWWNLSNAQSHSQVQDGCFDLLIRSYMHCPNFHSNPPWPEAVPKTCPMPIVLHLVEHPVRPSPTQTPVAHAP
mgnify:CR=1 FL=1